LLLNPICERTLKAGKLMARYPTADPIIDYCFECAASVRFKILHVHRRASSDGCPEEYTLAGCSVCGEPSLFYRQEVDLQRERLEVDLPEFNRLYPSLPRLPKCHLPEVVDKPYLEACEAELMHLPTACAVMIGRALEAACRDFDPQTRTIADGLRRMQERGALGPELFEWASELRVLRNEAAHTSQRDVGEEDASEALDFLQAILEILYDIRPKFERFRSRRRPPPESTLRADK
jgi:Domain of unknown function (DUF4145)